MVDIDHFTWYKQKECCVKLLCFELALLWLIGYDAIKDIFLLFI